MIAIVCIDDHGGMLFNHRRQSRDREQIADMLRVVEKGRLLCAPYSRPLFVPEGENPIFDEAFLERAKEGDYCFVEDRPLLPYLEKLEAVIVYRWNRTYPRDMVLDIPLPGPFHLIERRDLPGYSHEMMTRERYER